MSHAHTIILGIIEGITEFLPISSTAHIDIARELLGIVSTDFIKSFQITIQLGAILAVVFLYFKKLTTNINVIKNILIAFIPTGIIGFILYKIIKTFLLGNAVLAAVVLILGGIVIIYFENKFTKRKNNLYIKNELNTPERDIANLTTKELLILGTFQALAVVPGVSRSGAVIITGKVLGLSNILITEFSFLLAIPTMLSATAYDLLKSGFSFSKNEWGSILLGFIVSFIVALIVVKWLIGYVKTHSFKIFGWYRIIFGLVMLIIFLL